MPVVERLELASGEVVCERCVVADNPFLRLKGLLGRASLEPGDGVVLRPCGSIHTLFLRFPIDVVFCDRDLAVLSVSADVPPWRTRARRGARAVVELAAGEAARRGVVPGARLRLR